MGAKHSKPRIRRSGRFPSTRKRQAPEGSNDPVPVVNESWKQNITDKNFATTQHNEKNCNFCRPSEKCHDQQFEKYEHSKIGDVFMGARQSDFCRRDISKEKDSILDDFLNQTNMKVELPQSPSCCRNCETIEKSKSLPPKATLNDLTKISDKDEEEWTITLYEIDNKVQGRVPREDMVRLMSSIYEAVDNKIGEVPQGRKTVKVQVSVAPESRTQSKVMQRTSSAVHKEQSECRCQECPKTEPPNRRSAHESRIRRHKSDASPHRFQAKQISETPTTTQKSQNPWRQRSLCDHSTENKDRRRHYANLEGVDSSNQNRIANKETEFVNNTGRAKDSRIAKSRTLPPNYEERHQEKLEKGLNSKRRTRYQENADNKSAMLRIRRKDSRFASPYDQHFFQEAMYLRLRELQRQGANEVRRATGKFRDSDEADDDSDSELNVENEKSVIIESDDDNAELTSCKKSQVTNNKSCSEGVSVHHHHHYHHGLPENSFLSSICSTEPNSINQPSDDLNSSNAGDATMHHHYHHHYHHADKS